MNKNAALLFGLPLAVFAQHVQSAPEQVTYFLGEVRMSSPSGQPMGSSLSLVKRTLSPDENKIVELVVSIDPAKLTREFTTIFEVQGTKFVMKDGEGTFAGEGELSGKAWEWNGWKYEVDFTGPRKGRLRGEDILGPDGIQVKKSFATPDGVVRVQFNEDLKPISKVTYEILRAKVLTEQK